jgi:probable HAF family extracellular repeat protein
MAATMLLAGVAVLHPGAARAQTTYSVTILTTNGHSNPVPLDAASVRPVLWQNGTIKDLGGFLDFLTVQAEAINNQGVVVGLAQDSISNGTGAAWLWQNGTMTTLPSLKRGGGTKAFGINNRGQAVGASETAAANTIHAVMWQNGRAADLGTLPGGLFSEAVAINASSVAVGVSTLNGGDFFGGDRHAAVFQNGMVTDLTFDLPPGLSGFATAINSSGQVVGASAGRPFIWTNGVGTDLNTLIPTNPKIVLVSPTGINDKGQIVVIGRLGSDEFRIDSRVFLLTPNPTSAVVGLRSR